MIVAAPATLVRRVSAAEKERPPQTCPTPRSLAGPAAPTMLATLRSEAGDLPDAADTSSRFVHAGDVENTPRPAEAPPRRIQRKVGFEAELSVPSYGAAPATVDPTRLAAGRGGQATPAIEQFLFGGLPYGSDRGSNARFRLTTDHNELQSRMIDIWRELHTMGLLLQIPKRTTSNLEYVTVALDELAPGSTAAFTAQFDAVRDHAAALFPNARNQMLAVGAPAASTFTGLPVADLQAWLGTDYARVSALVDAFQTTVEDSFYLQATAGVLPSQLRALHQRHTPADPDALGVPVADKAMWAADRLATAVLAAPWFVNHAYVQEMRLGKAGSFLSSARPARPIDYDSFAGVIHLLAMYRVGNALNQTNAYEGSSAKNAVPFLSKMQNKRDIVTKAAPGLHAHRPPDDLVDLIDRAFASSGWTSVDTWVALGLADRRGTEGRGPIVGDTFVKDVLESRWEIFGTATAQAVGSPRSYESPDTLPVEVSAASGGQQGAQFEYRYIRDRPPPATLGAALMRVVDEIRDLNLAHVDNGTRAAIRGRF